MTILMVVLLLGVWCALPFPLAVAVGRAFRAGESTELDQVSPQMPAA